jgi:hypothetical protein
MGFVVGKKAGAPDGTIVRFVLDGPGRDARQLTIAVEGGRARPTSAAVSPTVMLALSSLDFLRLGCGRETGAVMEASGRIVVEGDEVVAREILGAMNFMF